MSESQKDVIEINDFISRVGQDWISSTIIMEDKAAKGGYDSLSEEWALQRVRKYSEVIINNYYDDLVRQHESGDITEKQLAALKTSLQPVLDRDYSYPRRWINSLPTPNWRKDE